MPRPSLSEVLGPRTPEQATPDAETQQPTKTSSAKGETPAAKQNAIARRKAPKEPSPAKSQAGATPPRIAPAASSSVSDDAEIGRRRRGYKQLNILVTAEMRRNVKIECLRQGRDMSDVVTALLSEWLAGRIDA